MSYYNGNSYTFTWENGRQLATVSSDDFELEFVYNDEGIRTQKIVNDSEIHTYHLSGTDIIAEEWGSNLIVYLYDSGGSPMGMQYHRNSMDVGEFYTFWFEKNLQGDIVAVYNSAGIKVISYSYDAWGNCITKHHNLTGTNSYATFNPFRYRGYYYDSELGFYYLNSRYYDPAVGRFINADEYINANGGLIGFNMFAYCNNMPVNNYDPSGALMYDSTEPDSMSSYSSKEIEFIKNTAPSGLTMNEVIPYFEAYVQSVADAHGMDYQEMEDAILWSIISGEPWANYSTEFEDFTTVYTNNLIGSTLGYEGATGEAFSKAYSRYTNTTGIISEWENDMIIYNRHPQDKFTAMFITSCAVGVDLLCGKLFGGMIPPVSAALSTGIYYMKQSAKRIFIGY